MLVWSLKLYIDSGCLSPITASPCIQEEGKPMSRYLEGFSAATQRAQGAPNLTLIADVSLSTFTYYIAQGAKAHRSVSQHDY
jgi:hypothetical protein